MVAFSSPRRGAVPMSFVQLIAYSLLFLQLAAVVDAGKFTNKCKSMLCLGSDDNSQPLKADGGVQCVNKKAPKKKEGWAIYKAKDFPKVADIVADLKTCGIVTQEDVTTLFYSYGGGLTNAKKFQAKNPDLKALHINDVMPNSWYDALAKFPGMASAKSSAQNAWVARSSQALAKVSKGKVYLVASPSANIYTTPFVDTNPTEAWRGAHNVWYDYEFATLQKNTAVSGIYSVNSDTLAIDETPEGSWVRDRSPPGDAAAVDINADTVTPQSIDAKKGACAAPQKRGAKSSSAADSDAPACAMPTATGTGTKTGTATGTETGTATGTETGTATGTKTGTATGTTTTSGKSSSTATTLITKTSSSTSSTITKSADSTSTKSSASKTDTKTKSSSSKKSSATKVCKSKKKC